MAKKVKKGPSAIHEERRIKRLKAEGKYEPEPEPEVKPNEPEPEPEEPTTE